MLLRREAITGYIFILPWIVGFLCFIAFPLLFSAYISLTSYDALTAPSWVGLQNYGRIFSGADPLVSTSLLNTVFYVFLAVPASLVVSLGLALLLNQRVRGIAIFRTLFYMPTVVPIVASISILTWVFQGQFGLLNDLLALVGIRGPGWLTDPAWVKWTLIIWAVWNCGGSMLIFLAGLQAVPSELLEAATIDGAGAVRRFLHVTLPMLSPIVFFNLVIGLIAAFQIFLPALLLQGNNPFAVSGGPLNSLLFYVLYIYQNGFIFYKMGYASALSWVLFLAVLLTTALLFRFGSRWVYYEVDGA